MAPQGLQEATTAKENADRGDETRVEPLPRFNFASVSVEDPFLSPLLAEDHILEGLPPIHLMVWNSAVVCKAGFAFARLTIVGSLQACHLDPLLDDSISEISVLRGPTEYNARTRLI